LVGWHRLFQGIPSGTAHLYDSIAARYLEPSYGYVVEDLMFRGLRDFVFVEFGSGTGRLLSEVIIKLKPKFAVGLDISRAMVEISRRNLIRDGSYRDADLLVADAHKMPFRDYAVDIIVSTGTLHHIRSPTELFRECLRVLKVGGEAWIYEFSYDAECGEESRRMRRPCALLKVLATLHGLPRRAFKKGYIREALEKAECESSVDFRGIITRLKLSRK